MFGNQSGRCISDSVRYFCLRISQVYVFMRISQVCVFWNQSDWNSNTRTWQFSKTHVPDWFQNTFTGLISKHTYLTDFQTHVPEWFPNIPTLPDWFPNTLTLPDWSDWLVFQTCAWLRQLRIILLMYGQKLVPIDAWPTLYYR